MRVASSPVPEGKGNDQTKPPGPVPCIFSTHQRANRLILPALMQAMTTEVTEDVQKAAAWTGSLRKEIGQVIVGQEHLVDNHLADLLAQAAGPGGGLLHILSHFRRHGLH